MNTNAAFKLKQFAGWTNYETQYVSDHIDNSGMLPIVEDMCRVALNVFKHQDDAIKSASAAVAKELQTVLLRELPELALGAVNWYELAEAFVDIVAEEFDTVRIRLW